MSEQQFEYKGLIVRLEPDTNAEPPDSWEEDDPDVFLVTTRNRYFERLYKGSTTYRGGEDAKQVMDPEKKDWRKGYWIFPLFAYIHSGVALRMGERGGYPFDCPWDSGQIGWVFVRKAAGFRLSKKAEKAGDGYVEVWNQFLSGDVWGVVVEDKDGKHLDSCWGFYGREYAIEEGKRMAGWQAGKAEKVDQMEERSFAL